MQTVKMVITGALASGKSEFIKTISETGVVSTERKTSDEASLLKKETTVAMDFGRIIADEDLVVHLFGTPGQKRFDFMWQLLSEGMIGMVVLVDSTRPDSFRETNRIIEFFTAISKAPYVIACNKQDLPDAWTPEDIRHSLRLSDDIKVLPCVALDPRPSRNVILELLYSILDRTAEVA